VHSRRKYDRAERPTTTVSSLKNLCQPILILDIKLVRSNRALVVQFLSKICGGGSILPES
ncbi:MAG: hypothetical protein AB7E55_32815, partial [Pigmentiphaga sp.]